MDAVAAATRWAQTWERAWPAGDGEAIAALYADGAAYRSHPLRVPEEGGALGYTARQFPREGDVRCHFAAPIAADSRAAVEWWASFVEDDEEHTLAGTTVLDFDAFGLVVSHVDYWVHGDGRRAPFAGWGNRPSE